ncbi:MAG: VCBS repeat-containing protein [Pseudomonadota bacterium]
MTRTTFWLSVAAALVSGCGGSSGGGALGPPPPPASSRYSDVSSASLPTDVRPRMCMDVTAADVDADGDLDLALAIEFGLPALLRNDGNGVFSSTAADVPAGDGDNEDVLLADFDGDGDLDLFAAHEDDGVHALLLNDGSGVFSDASNRIPVQSIANAAETTDVNGDGRLDILLGNRGGNLLLLGQADGTFASSPGALPGVATTQDLLLVDVDNDADLDIFVANETANQLLINTNGSYVDESAARLPPGVRETREADAADVDNDGDFDIIVGNVAFVGAGSVANQLLINDGSGRFIDGSAPALDATTNNARSFTVRFADIDADGDADILSPANQIGNGGELFVWSNDGAGSFADASGLFNAPVDGSVFDVEFFDANGDGRLDLYFCHRTGSDQLYLAN